MTLKSKISGFVFANKLRSKLVKCSDEELGIFRDELLREMNRRIKKKTNKRINFVSE